MYPKSYLNMKSAIMIDEESRQISKLQEHSHISTPTLLTLEDISPKWALRLKNENMPSLLSPTWLQWRFELQRSSKCVVGEAYGYSSEYTENCDECDRIGCKFLYYFTLNWRSKLILNKQQFVRHWNEVHSRSFTSSSYYQ